MPNKWEERVFDVRKSFVLDKTFIKKNFNLFGFILFERIRVVQYPEEGVPLLIYSKSLKPASTRQMDRLIKNGFNPYRTAYNFLSKIFNKSDQTYDIRNSKYMVHPFVRNLFKDITRDEKLEKLLNENDCY